MNKVWIIPYDLWRVGVEIFHMDCMNQRCWFGIKEWHIIEVIISFQTFFICVHVGVFVCAFRSLAYYTLINYNKLHYYQYLSTTCWLAFSFGWINTKIIFKHRKFYSLVFNIFNCLIEYNTHISTNIFILKDKDYVRRHGILDDGRMLDRYIVLCAICFEIYEVWITKVAFES